MSEGQQTTPPDLVLVTGGTGFLGTWTIAQLLNRGFTVRTTVRDRAREPELRAALRQVTGDVGKRLAVVQADLESDAGWEPAMRGVHAVLHTASPFPARQPKNPDDVIRPATQGTLRVLNAAFAANVQRVVLTSSSNAVHRPGQSSGPPLTESDWADPDDPKMTPYARSKTLAERAAWKFVADHDSATQLTTICPTAMLGPVLNEHRSYSLQVIERMLAGMPGLPRLGFSLVDVRDVALLHIDAMIEPKAAGQRFLAAGPFLWFAEVAAILSDYGPETSKIRTRVLPNWLIRLNALSDPGTRAVIGELGHRTDYSTDKAKTQLRWTARDTRETIHDTARSLLESGSNRAKAHTGS